jgi:hypothetical protein
LARRVRQLVLGGCGEFELAFLGDALVSLGQAFDTVLKVVTVGRKKPHNLVAAFNTNAARKRGRKKNGFANRELMHVDTPID